MDHLVIDVGNTRSKLALFRGGRLVRWLKVEVPSREVVQGFVGADVLSSIAIATVGAAVKDMAEALSRMAPVYIITSATRVPIGNAYGTPGTLGVDRLANAVGAAERCPGRPVLVVDAGTCITYDLVDADGVFRGGGISPGLQLRSKAMHEHSAHLPRVDLTSTAPVLAGTTVDALRSGILHGARFELRGFVTELTYQFPDLVVLVTGGDGVWAARALKSGIFALPFLTLEGLYAILHHQLELGSPPTVHGPGSGAAG